MRPIYLKGFPVLRPLGFLICFRSIGSDYYREKFLIKLSFHYWRFRVHRSYLSVTVTSLEEQRYKFLGAFILVSKNALFDLIRIWLCYKQVSITQILCCPSITTWFTFLDVKSMVSQKENFQALSLDFEKGFKVSFVRPSQETIL